MRTVAIVTSARSDFGLYVPLLEDLRHRGDVRLWIFATGMHLAAEFGSSYRWIEEAGYDITCRVESLVPSDSPAGIAASIGRGVSGFAKVLESHRPDILVVLGDRFDMYPAAIAALPYRIPVAHIAGGELTEGALDDSLRHSLTKLSHLHFVATEEYGRRVIQMGEEPWRVTITGALGTDNIRARAFASGDELSTRYHIKSGDVFALVTFHPVTLEAENTYRYIHTLLDALDLLRIPCVFTYPNADTGSRVIIDALEHYCRGKGNCQVVINAGQRDYLGLMNAASVMIGNSSSGIVEAASFGLPVVNIGTRQHGRVRGANVVDCLPTTESIVAATRHALEPSFRQAVEGMPNPYGDGHAAERIAVRLAEVQLNDRLLRKSFHDLQG